MPHDVFISHSSQDKPVADAVCAALEGAAIRCWIAPRDVQPGRSFAGEITRAIQRSKVMALIFSAYSNTSEQVLREVQLAANSHLHIVQFRIADVLPNDDLEYYLSTPHWLDALTPPLEGHLDRLQNSIKALLQLEKGEPAATPTSAAREKPVPPLPFVAVSPPPAAKKPKQPLTRHVVWMATTAAAVLVGGTVVLSYLLFSKGSRPAAAEKASPISVKSPAASAPSPASSPAIVSAGKTGASVPPPEISASAGPKPAGFLGVRGGNSITASAVIEAIVPDSPAEEAHLQKGDVIRKFNGREVKNFPELRSFIGQTALHKRIDLEFEREGKPMQVSTELRVYPPDSRTASATESPAVVMTTPSEQMPSVEATPGNPALMSGPDKLQVANRFLNDGWVRQSAGDNDGAIAAYTESLRYSSDSPAPYFNRARAYLDKGKYDQVIADTTKALDLGFVIPADAYVLRGMARAQKRDFKGGLADCNQAIKLNPQHALAYNNRANNRMNLGDYDGALADCNKSISLDETSALPYYNRGYYYMNKGNAAKAIADWNKAMEVQPTLQTELAPLVKRLGGTPNVKKATTTNTASSSSDLVNPSQLLVGTWEGGRHRTQYFPDGTFVTDPHLVPNPPKGQWHLDGDKLIQYFPEAGVTVKLVIVSVTKQDLVTRDEQGRAYQSKRLGK
jgi:tetratricopeptide (TPR) repeat protein